MERDVTMSARTGGKQSGRRAGVRGWLQRAIGDRRGVAAVEFALIVPLLLCLYLVTMEASQGIETNKKVSRVASMVADLIAQQQSMTTTDIDAVMQIGEALLQPYNRSRPGIFVTAIEITNEATPRALVFWSRKLVNGVPAAYRTKGNVVTIPNVLKVPGSFLVQVVSHLDYKPVISWSASDTAALGLISAFDDISMDETYYLRPRMSTQVACSNC